MFTKIVKKPNNEDYDFNSSVGEINIDKTIQNIYYNYEFYYDDVHITKHCINQINNFFSCDSLRIVQKM